MKITVTGEPNFATRLAADARGLRTAAAAAVEQAAEGLKAGPRAQAVAAGLGQRHVSHKNAVDAGFKATGA